MELASSVSGSRLRVQSLLPQQSKDNTHTVIRVLLLYANSLQPPLPLLLYLVLFLSSYSSSAHALFSVFARMVSICVKNEEGGFVESWFFPLPPALELHCVA
jgi:hypothetical protein